MSIMSFAKEFGINFNNTQSSENTSILFECYGKLPLFFLPFDFSVLLMNCYHPYVMSLLGSVLVGLSGILPFMVISLDDTATLKTGAGAKTLRLLLSFAVGGLLGDVFLHLLPEAWENQQSSDMVNSTSHLQLRSGLWVLTGLLAFIIIEKMFSFEKEEEKENEDDERKLNKALNGSLNGTNKQKTTSIRRKKSSFILNDLTKNFATEVSSTKGSVDDINVNNNNKTGKKISAPVIKKPSNVHISGYLNLIANAIDNFTHGLAVGGSFLLSTRVGILTTFAILVHEIPHEIGDFAILLRAGFSRWEAAWAQLYTAFAGILGAFTALMFSASSSAVEARTTWILPFTAGGFLHIALVTVLPELLSEKNPKESLKQLCSLASGITVMAFLTIFIEGED